MMKPANTAAEIKVGIVEDHTSTRDSLAVLLNGTPGFRCVCACKDAAEALRQAPQEVPNVVLMDINLPGISGIECVRKLKERFPQMQIAMLTVEEDSELVFNSLAAGASGYLVKHVAPAKLLEAIEEIHCGGSPMSSQVARLLVRSFQQNRPSATAIEERLTEREEEILTLIAKGKRSKEVAQMLAISARTVESHFRNIYEKTACEVTRRSCRPFFAPGQKRPRG